MSSGQVPGLPQPKGTPAPWSHKGSRAGSAAQHKALGHSCSPALPVTHIPPPLPHQSSLFPHTPSKGQEERRGPHLELFNPHPGCSITTRIRNLATSSASQTLSLAWLSPELGKLLSQAHKNTTSSQRLNVSQQRDTPKPSGFYQTLNPTHWLYDFGFSHCPTFEKVCSTWKHLRNNIHSIL